MGTNLKSQCEQVTSELQAHAQEKKKSKNKQVQPIIPPVLELPSEQVSTFVTINGTHSHPQGTTTEGSIQTWRSACVHNMAVCVASPAPKGATEFDGGEYTSEPEMDSGDEVTPTARNKGKGRPSGNRSLLDPRIPETSSSLCLSSIYFLLIHSQVLKSIRQILLYVSIMLNLLR